MYQTYKDRAEFYLVYIREAHPTDGWRIQGNVEVADPDTQKERQDVAQVCSLKLDLSMPVLVDDTADSVNLAYAAWPERLYVIGKDGTIAYAGGMGPMLFKPEECEAFLVEHLADPKHCKSEASSAEKK